MIRAGDAGKRTLEDTMQTHRTLSPLALALGLGLAVAPLTLALARPATTLHVEVIEESGAEPAVKVAVPVDVIAAFAGAMHGEDFAPGALLDEMNHEGFDLRAFWREIRQGNLREFVTVEAKEARVKAWRENGLFRVSVDADEDADRNRFGGRTRVEIRVPEELMDYLVDEGSRGTPSDLVDILKRMGPSTLVEVVSESESVRVWLD